MEAADTAGAGDGPVARYVAAARDGDYERARAVAIQALDSGLEPVRVLTDVVAAAMRHIGELWEARVLTTADEHLATAITERVLADVYPSLFEAPPLSRETVLVASVHGETHVLGSRMNADVLEGAGFRVIFLGGDLPHPDLLAAIERHRPAAVLLGATSTWASDALRDAVDRIGENDSALPVLVGGPAARSVPGEGGRPRFVRDAAEVVGAVEAVLQGARRSS
jgi:methanogenic corrinoid protein MtbC1